MRILGNAFNGTREFYYTDWELSYTAGSARWFPEFTPVNLVTLRFMFDLLMHFLRHDICCHIDGAFSTYLAGVQTGFTRVSFFIALKDSPLLNLLFQREETLRESFYLGCYDFELYQNLQNMDACRYFVRRGGLQYAFTFLGIDSLVECGTQSNVEFIHFVWRYVEAQNAFRRHAITLLPAQDDFTTNLLCIRHYDVQVPGGPLGRTVQFALVWLESRYPLSPVALLRLKLAVVLSARGGPITEGPGFPNIFHPGAKNRAIQADAARYLFAVSCCLRLGLISSGFSLPNILT